MHPDFWHERWAQGQIGFHESRVNAYLQRYWDATAGASPGRVLVPMCGKSLDMLWLAEKGWSVLGVELSQLAVESFFREWGVQPVEQASAGFRCYRHEQVEILCGDFFHLEPLQLEGVTAVYDRASLVALPPDMRERYAGHLGALLPRANHLLVTVDYDQDKMKGPPFAVAGSEVRWLYGQHYQVGVLYTEDVLAENPRFAQRGLDRLQETVFRLQPHPGA